MDTNDKYLIEQQEPLYKSHPALKLKGKKINKLPQYIIETRNGMLFYLKDGNHHRDLGPAMYFEVDKDKYFALGDEDLYQPNTFEYNLVDPLVVMLSATLLNAVGERAAYYLEGEIHTNEQFNSILEKKKLHAELSKELPNSEIYEKKPKV